MVFDQPEVLAQGFGNVVVDGGLYVPVPLRVQVGIGYHVGFVLFFLLGEERERSKEA